MGFDYGSWRVTASSLQIAETTPQASFSRSICWTCQNKEKKMNSGALFVFPE